MPGSHWMISLYPHQYAAIQGKNFSILPLRARHRKKAERMVSGDRVLYYVLQERQFPATATVTSGYFEERSPLWPPRPREERYPYRVHTRANIVLYQGEAVDAEELAPRLAYVKRWPPEHWPLALQGDLHVLSAQDFQLVENEMQRVVGRRSRTRDGPGHPSGVPRDVPT